MIVDVCAWRYSVKFIDLSHPLIDGQVSFPGDPPLNVEFACTTKMPARCNVSKIAMGSHQGTHLDAMFHFVEDGKTLDNMPLDWFYGLARILRIPKNAGDDISVEDFLPFEEHLAEGARIIYETGWHRQFQKPNYFTEFPSLTQEAARFLASKKLRLLGMDTPTPAKDYYEVHHILLGEEIVIIESLTKLDNAPDSFTLCAFPLNFSGRDGSPVRAVAIIP
jgi:arylformamidase